MCGIFGFTGKSQDVWGSVALALKKLEYRGYDSWGIAWTDDEAIHATKDVGRIVDATPVVEASSVAIGHTRWATHGGVTQINAHPHFDSGKSLALVHNGIVENMEALVQTFEPGHIFVSQTDTEVIAHLIEREVASGSNVHDAVASVFRQLEGCNAVVVIDRANEALIVAKRISPLLLGLSNGSSFVTSDALALLGHCDQMVVMPDDTIARCTKDGIELQDVMTGQVIALATEPVPVLQGLWATSDDSHFMETEMRQQPAVLRQLVGPGNTAFDRMVEQIRPADEIVLTGCGSALFAARLGVTYLRMITGIRTTAVAASELEHELPFLAPNALVIALSQSGETADVIDAMIKTRQRGFATAALVNVMHSTLARMVDVAVPLGAGQEQCVLATKSWFAKVGLLLKLAAAVGSENHHGNDVFAAASIVENLLSSPEMLARILNISDRLASAGNALVIGRGLGAATAQEIALKIKEASYVHAEAFAAGELKHGAIALVSDGTPCLIVGGHDPFGEDAETTAHELLSRGGYTIGIGTGPGASFVENIEIPVTGFATPLAQVLIAQMLAYRTALAKGINPDRPRNLAKSVTVK